MLTLLKLILLFILISILIAVVRFIFAVIRGMILIKRSVRENEYNEYRNTTYEKGKTIELGKDQYKVE